MIFNKHTVNKLLHKITVEIHQLPEKPQPIWTQQLGTFLRIFQDLLQSSELFCLKQLLHFQPLIK